MAGMQRMTRVIASLVMLGGCAARPPQEAPAAGAEEAVRSTELAFAKAMADRDFDAFASHLSVEAVFFDEGKVLHGNAEVSAAWKPLFRDPKAPFSWAPDHVEVLASGDLALSTGPVKVDGKVVGRFNSIWRLEAPHTWRIVFDKGEPVCADAAQQALIPSLRDQGPRDEALPKSLNTLDFGNTITGTHGADRYNKT